MKYINLTSHPIKLNDGREFPPSGKTVRVETTYEGDGDVRKITFGKPNIELPEPQAGLMYIVSGLMAKETIRPDFVAPATGHTETIRNEKGHVVSVPFFVKE